MWQQHLTLVAVGLVGGLVGGLLGVGGSVVMIPAMTTVFGPAQHLYQGAAMIVNFFVALPSVIQHRKAGAILRPIVQMMVPPAVVSVVGGVWLSKGYWFQGANEIYLSRVFGLFLVYVVLYNGYRLFVSRRLPEMDAAAAAAIPGWRIALAVGVPTGLLGGLLGIGGGAIAVPLQQVILRVPLRRAIANSAVTILPLSLVGATYKNFTNVQAGISLAESFRLAVFLIPTAIIGGYLGSYLTHAAPRRFLRGAFILLMCYAAWSMLTRQARANTNNAAHRASAASRCAARV